MVTIYKNELFTLLQKVAKKPKANKLASLCYKLKIDPQYKSKLIKNNIKYILLNLISFNINIKFN